MTKTEVQKCRYVPGMKNVEVVLISSGINSIETPELVEQDSHLLFERVQLFVVFRSTPIKVSSPNSSSAKKFKYSRGMLRPSTWYNIHLVSHSHDNMVRIKKQKKGCGLPLKTTGCLRPFNRGVSSHNVRLGSKHFRL